jgi:hypothetical protein
MKKNKIFSLGGSVINQKNQKGSTATIVLIVIIIAITTSVLTWMFTKKAEAPTEIIKPVEKTQVQADIPEVISEQKNTAKSENISIVNQGNVNKVEGTDNQAVKQSVSNPKIQKLAINMDQNPEFITTDVGNIRYTVGEVARYRLTNPDEASLYAIKLFDSKGALAVNLQDIPSNEVIVIVNFKAKNLSSKLQSLSESPVFSVKYTSPKLRAASQDAPMSLVQSSMGSILAKKTGEYTYVYSTYDYDVDHVVVEGNGSKPFTAMYDLNLGKESYLK